MTSIVLFWQAGTKSFNLNYNFSAFNEILNMVNFDPEWPPKYFFENLTFKEFDLKCNFTSLAEIQQMAKFDPKRPWLKLCPLPDARSFIKTYNFTFWENFTMWSNLTSNDLMWPQGQIWTQMTAADLSAKFEKYFHIRKIISSIFLLK